MQGIISTLKESDLFTSVHVTELIDEESIKLIKVKAEIKDGSILFITELHTMDYQKYSYHWQDTDNRLIMRWDNKPHWKSIRTYPYHKHDGENVFPSPRIDILEVIEAIRNHISKTK